MIRSMIARLSFMIGVAEALTGCSRAESLAERLCACEGCDDHEESFVRMKFETQENVAEAYHCGDEWNALASCIEEHAYCNVALGRLRTRAPGSCSDAMDIEIPCVTDADCAFAVSTFCGNNTCMQRVCAQMGNQCSTDSECDGVGPDLCDPAQDAMDSCNLAASAHGD